MTTASRTPAYSGRRGSCPAIHLRFYVDGQPDGKQLLFGAGLPVKLTGVRLGGYNVWQDQPGANFAGTLDDVRVYRGMLTAAQVMELAQPNQ